jgi:hypothetical protein
MLGANKLGSCLNEDQINAMKHTSTLDEMVLTLEDYNGDKL